MQADPPREAARVGLSPAWVTAVSSVTACVLGGLSLMFCTVAVRDIRDDLRLERWPVVDARIAQSHVQAVHRPSGHRQPAWDGWCVSWDYAYDWQGSRRSGVVQDDTPSTLSPGCFASESNARHLTFRRPLGSTLRVRVDPEESWTSSPYPASVKTGDIIFLVAGAGMAIVAAAFVATAVRARRRAGVQP
jgi:hypothetical protein